MLRDIRIDYESSSIDKETINPDPLKQFQEWMNEALASQQLEPTAMVLSTVDDQLQPHSRVVLLKELSEMGFTFYTNYEGHKAQQIAQNSAVSLLFFWPLLERQVRITGRIEKTDEASSLEYFKTRPLDSQLGAWASPQSEVIPNHKFLEKRFQHYKNKFNNDVPKPIHWGGYIVKPQSIEFWQGRRNRLHDRLLFTLLDNQWSIATLAP